MVEVYKLKTRSPLLLDIALKTARELNCPVKVVDPARVVDSTTATFIFGENNQDHAAFFEKLIREEARLLRTGARIRYTLSSAILGS